MAENQEPPTPPTGMPALPAPPAGAQPALPPGLNADEYRRFQEFQRFQDYQRFVEAQQRGEQPSQQPAPAPAPTAAPSDELATHLSAMRQQLARIERVTNPPTWQKILRNKWLHRGIWLLIIVLLATWGVPTLIRHYFGNNDSANGPAEQPAPSKGGSGELETTVQQTVFNIYNYVALDSPDQVCFLFDNRTSSEFAHAFGTSNCAAAVAKIHSGLKDPNAYAEPDLRSLPEPPLNQRQDTVSSCSFTVSGGPRLGAFTLTRQPEDNRWLITGFRTESNCPSSTPSTPPT